MAAERVPYELWRSILRAATPDLDEVSSPPFYYTPRLTTLGNDKRRRLSLTSLALVNRTFYDVATKLIWSNIVLPSTHSTAPIVAKAEKPLLFSDGADPRGAYCTSVYVLLPWDNLVEETVKSLGSFPNATTVYFHHHPLTPAFSPGPDIPPLLQRLSSVCPRISNMRLQSPTHPVRGHIVLSLSDHFKDLQSLTIMHTSDRALSSDVLIFNKLRSLSLGFTDYQPDRPTTSPPSGISLMALLRVPAITTLHLWHDLPGMDAFLDLHGSRIRAASLAASSKVLKGVGTLEITFPTLRELTVITTRHSPTFVVAHSVLKSVYLRCFIQSFACDWNPHRL